MRTMKEKNNCVV